MNRLLSQMQFMYPWRAYQEKVLNELDKFLKDGHLHVVAPPGSGKTVLGLEVIKRLCSPAIIFAPTVTIKNQWIDRFTELFLPDDSIIKSQLDQFVSMDIRNLKLLNAVTYQALHAYANGLKYIEANEEVFDDNDEAQATQMAGVTDSHTTDSHTIDSHIAAGTASKTQNFEENLKNLLEIFRKLGIKTILVDEAHHLRAEWWKSLIYLKENLKDVTFVALTATPPYDCEKSEWDKYQKLCGEIDVEIYVPELVKNGDLCPHQDYIYVSIPKPKEKERLDMLNNRIQEAFVKLIKDTAFLEALTQHPCIVRPYQEKNMETILDNPDDFTAIVVFLAKAGIKVNSGIMDILDIQRKMPLFTRELAETLLTYIFFKDNEMNTLHKTLIRRIKADFTEAGAIENKSVVLGGTKDILNLMSQSISKLESILHIVELEQNTLNQDLRMVILTDFIRKDEHYKTPSELNEIRRIGVVPIFDYLRLSFDICLNGEQSSTNGITTRQFKTNIGILCGTYIMIPASSKDALIPILQKYSLSEKDISIKPYSYDPAYLEVIPGSKAKKSIVPVMTDLFEMGGIHILIGTTALLGEGWDAPCVNALILASFVGSFMLSNQMRGRAIRSYRKNKDKTSNIWHLMCIEPTDRHQPDKTTDHSASQYLKNIFVQSESKNTQNEIETMKRRSLAFPGVSFVDNCIEAGFYRFGFDETHLNTSTIDAFNRKMTEAAHDRSEMAKRWENASSGNLGSSMKKAAVVKAAVLPRQFIFRKNKAALILYTMLEMLCVLMSLIGLGVIETGDLKILENSTFIGYAAGVAAFLILPKFLHELNLHKKHRNDVRSLYTAAMIILRTLCKLGLVKKPLHKLKIKVNTTPAGDSALTVSGLESFEENLFHEALGQLFDRIGNPRYLIKMKQQGFGGKYYYYQLPSEFGRNKENAEYFQRLWHQEVGKNQLIYTRNLDGKKELQRAKMAMDDMKSFGQTESFKTWAR